MDIIDFTKNIKYNDFTHDMVKYFSQNAAIYEILKNNSDSIKINAIDSGNQIVYTISSSKFNLDILANLFKSPVTIFGSTQLAIVSKESRSKLKVIFKL